MNKRLALPTLLLAAAAAGCGSHAANSTPTTSPPKTSTPNKTYVDPNFGFRFSYPGNWKAPKQGSTKKATGPNVYFVDLTLPNDVAGVHVKLSGEVTQFPPIKDGEKHKDPHGPDIFTYYHARVSGRPALRVLRSYQGKVDEVATFVNVRRAEYAISELTINPPFPAFVTAGYNLILRTFHIPRNT